MMKEDSQQDWLDRRLQEAAPYIEDDGFTARVLQLLPASQRRTEFLRPLILVGMSAFASRNVQVNDYSDPVGGSVCLGQRNVGHGRRYLRRDCEDNSIRALASTSILRLPYRAGDVRAGLALSGGGSIFLHCQVCVVHLPSQNRGMLRNIPSATLKQLVKLSERKEALMTQIQEIDRELIRVQNKFGIPAREDAQRAPVTISRVGRKPRRKRVERGSR